jgi:hypothetical protein
MGTSTGARRSIRHNPKPLKKANGGGPMNPFTYRVVPTDSTALKESCPLIVVEVISEACEGQC